MTTTSSTPRDTPDDQDVFDALSALRGAAPEPRDLSALRRRLASAPSHRTARRTAGAIATATAAVGVGIALLPGADDPASRSSPLGALGTPSALASEVPPVRDGPFRYARTRLVSTYAVTSGDRTARRVVQDDVESWVSAGWRGRELTVEQPGRTTGDPEAARKLPDVARDGDRRDGTYAYGDGPLATLDPADLPTGREALERTIRDGIRDDRWGPRDRDGSHAQEVGGASQDAHVGYSIVGLLVHARLTADQRAAFLEILQSDPDARSGGVGVDGEGRRGRVIDLRYAGEQSLVGVQGLRVLFDPGSAEILEWSTVPSPQVGDSPTLASTETVLRSAYVQSTHARP